MSSNDLAGDVGNSMASHVYVMSCSATLTNLMSMFVFSCKQINRCQGFVITITINVPLKST